MSIVHDIRQIAQTQPQLETALLMTPAARAQLQGNKQPTDLVAMMAQAAAAEPAEPEAVEAPESAEDES